MKPITAFYYTWSIFYQTHVHLRTAKKNPHLLTELKLKWAERVLKILNVEIEVIGESSSQLSLLFLGNHISYLDIPILMATCEDIAFVAKSDVRSWPVIGTAADLIGTVFVKREKKDSRAQAKIQISENLKKNKRIVIFPSGTTCMSESKPWKNGAFDIARRSQTLVQPFRLTYTPLRDAAYIDDDTFIAHLFNLFKQPQIQAKIEFHQPVTISDVEADCAYWQKWSKGLIPSTGAADAEM